MIHQLSTSISGQILLAFAGVGMVVVGALLFIAVVFVFQIAARTIKNVRSARKGDSPYNAIPLRGPVKTRDGDSDRCNRLQCANSTVLNDAASSDDLPKKPISEVSA